jgi:hypothetical protein
LGTLPAIYAGIWQSVDTRWRVSMVGMYITRGSPAGGSADSVTGRGTGVDDAGLRAKRDIVRSAHQRASAAAASTSDILPAGDGSVTGCDGCSPTHAKFMLMQLGGLELAAMAGLMLAAAEVCLATCVSCDQIETPSLVVPL